MMAIERSLQQGFSIETDIRDFAGRVVVSHDPPSGLRRPYYLDELLALHAGSESYLALNVKSDGLLELLGDPLPNAFFFDMSAPEAVKFSESAHKLGLRLSDLEPNILPVNTRHEWLWVDSFLHDWFLEESVTSYRKYQGVVFISPEIHGRDREPTWKWLLDKWETEPNICICTDYPEGFMERLP
jgi:hypothetical protein